MERLSVKAIIKDPYFKVPDWLNSNPDYVEYVRLSGKSTRDEVDLFIAELFGYMRINVDSTPRQVFGEILNETVAAIAGGVLFESDTKKIWPSCCSGLEGWREILKCVTEKRSPWMGHDPAPSMEFINNKVQVWSDDVTGKITKNPDKNGMFFIEYEQEELISKLERIETDLLDFAHNPLFNRLVEIDDQMEKSFVEKFESWFIYNS